MDDKEIIQKIHAGEHALYSELIRRYQDRILQLCVSMLSDFKDAEDAAQEIFIKAFYALDRYKGNSAFYTWLYRIASNHCLDFLRKKARGRTESLDALIEKSGDSLETLNSKETSHQTRDQELVHEILSHLPADYRLILTLREMQGLNYEEIALTLKCSIDAVKGRLKRARQDFKDKLRHFLKSKNV
jgi:RNA polymerase sigma-70 factor, ECF subfamily